MGKVRFFQVDAFTEVAFGGNPAAVCLLDGWPDDVLLQDIAKENNLSETAFLVPLAGEGGFDYHLRWFTPKVEVDLCGHATLASAHVLYDHLGFQGSALRFKSQTGLLSASRSEGMIWLDFPSRKPVQAALPAHILEAFGRPPVEVLLGQRDYLLVYGAEAEVAGLRPDFRALQELGLRGFIATAPGNERDFVSRCFFPAYGIDEDPVTGSAHCVSGPYWAEILGRSRLTARQISARGGELLLKIGPDRVRIGGRAVTVIEGHIFL